MPIIPIIIVVVSIIFSIIFSIAACLQRRKAQKQLAEALMASYETQRMLNNRIAANRMWMEENGIETFLDQE